MQSNSGYPLRNGAGYRKGRSNSARDDPEFGYNRSVSLGMHEFGENQPHLSARNRQSQRRYNGPQYSTPGNYNFVDEREPHRRGSSSDSIDRLSSPERVGHHRSVRRYPSKTNSSMGGEPRNYEDKIPPRRSTGGHFRDDVRSQNRSQGYMMNDGRHGGPKHKQDLGAGDYSMNGPDRQKLSEVPPNHSTESGYSSQSQHNNPVNREEGRGGPGMHMGGGGQPPRMRGNPPANGDMGPPSGVNMGHPSRGDHAEMASVRPKER